MKTSVRTFVILMGLALLFSLAQAQEEPAPNLMTEAASEPTTEPVSQSATEPVTEPLETLVLLGHPVYPPANAALVYKPLIDYLNDRLPYHFELQLAPDFHRYWLSARRNNDPQLVLEDAHIAAYRMTHHGYTPLVHASKPLSFSLLAMEYSEGARLEDFVGEPISSLPAPSLGYLVLTEWFNNPMQQPNIQSDAHSWQDVVEIIFGLDATAAIAPNSIAERYANLVTVATSREFPGLTLSAGPKVPESVQAEIQAALLTLHEEAAYYDVLHELGVDAFVTASESEYEGLERLLNRIYSSY